MSGGIDQNYCQSQNMCGIVFSGICEDLSQFKPPGDSRLVYNRGYII
jgi:hypothetical protein